jgi:hypothetical protein
MTSDETQKLLQAIGQQQETLRLLSAGITEKTHSQNPSAAYSRTIKPNRRNSPGKLENLKRVMRGLEPIRSFDNGPNPEPEPRHDPTEPFTLHSASTRKAAAEKTRKTYDLMHLITKG